MMAVFKGAEIQTVLTLTESELLLGGVAQA